MLGAEPVVTADSCRLPQRRCENPGGGIGEVGRGRGFPERERTDRVTETLWGEGLRLQDSLTGRKGEVRLGLHTKLPTGMTSALVQPLNNLDWLHICANDSPGKPDQVCLAYFQNPSTKGCPVITNAIGSSFPFLSQNLLWRFSRT